MSSILSKIKHLDLTLAVTCSLLLLIGLTLLYSIGFSDGKTLFIRQSINAVLAIAVFFFFTYFDFRIIAKGSRWYYIAFIFLLGLLLEVGRITKGSTRWFDLGFFNFQPAEFVKIVIIMLLARYFALRRGQIKAWRNILLSFVYVLLPIVLIAIQPDLGSAMIIGIIWLGILLVSNVEKKVFFYLFLIFTVFSAFAWNYLLHDYQRNRIETFLDPSIDPRGQGYNVRQAVIAVGSGEFFGRGLGKGLQSQLRFLPERQTDFIFASAAEEFGFFGTMFILILYFILLYRLLVIYRMSRDDLSRFIIVGIFFMILGQVVINIGMNMGVMPVTGIPLPFLSYGGSSLLSIAMALGIAQAVAIHAKGLRLS